MSDEINLKELFEEYEKTSAITVLPEGKHRLEVLSCSVRGKGVMPSYKILEGPDTGKRAMAGVISPGDTEGGKNAFFRKLEKFGLTKTYWDQRPGLADIAKALVGRVVVLELGVKDWQGEPRNEMGFNIELISTPALPPIGGGAAIPATVAAAPVTQVHPAPVVSNADPAPIVTAPVPAASAPTAVDGDPGF